jgi:hypothetical protein
MIDHFDFYHELDKNGLQFYNQAWVHWDVAQKEKMRVRGTL